MRTFCLLILLLFSNQGQTQQPGSVIQGTNKQTKITVSDPSFILPGKKDKPVNAELNLTNEIELSVKKKKINIFLLVENILGEITKPDPIINDQGFHFKANPDLEIPETMGKTGYIKFGIILRL